MVICFEQQTFLWCIILQQYKIYYFPDPIFVLQNAFPPLTKYQYRLGFLPKPASDVILGLLFTRIQEHLLAVAVFNQFALQKKAGIICHA